MLALIKLMLSHYYTTKGLSIAPPQRTDRMKAQNADESSACNVTRVDIQNLITDLCISLSNILKPQATKLRVLSGF